VRRGKAQAFRRQIPKRAHHGATFRRIPLIGKAIGFFAAAVGLYASYLVLTPRLTIYPPSDLVDSANPSKTPFLLNNDGYLAVYHIAVTCNPTIVAVEGDMSAAHGQRIRDRLQENVGFAPFASALDAREHWRLRAA